MKHLLICILLIGCSIHSNNSNVDCKTIMEGTFTSYFTANGSHNTIIINGNSHIEYSSNGTYITKSNLTWINNCAFVLTVLETNYEDNILKPNDTMTIQIEKVTDNVVNISATFKGKTIQIEYTKMK